MSPIELFEHQRHLTAAIHDQEKRIPTMDEVTKRLDRLKALGNGQVPRLAATAFSLLDRG